MKGLLTIQNSNSMSYIEGENYSFYIESDPFGYGVSINVDEELTFIEPIEEIKRKDILLGIRNCLSFLKSSKDNDSHKLIEFLSSHRGRESELIEKAEYVYFDLESKEIKEFIKKNPQILEKKILIRCDRNFGEEEFSEITSIFAGHLEKLCFEIEGNERLVGIETCRNTFTYIDTISKKVRSLGMSPLEELMYVYDIVRDRIYCEEDKDEDYTISRDLSQVIEGDKIVCCGFANIMNSILKKLGFNSNCYFLKSISLGEKGHERIVVFVDDDKYGIHGVYYFDPTWDSRWDKTRNFLYSYKYFAKTKGEIEKMKCVTYRDLTFKDFGREFVESFERKCLTDGIKKIPKKDVDLINMVAHFFGEKSLIPKGCRFDQHGRTFFWRKESHSKSIFNR